MPWDTVLDKNLRGVSLGRAGGFSVCHWNFRTKYTSVPATPVVRRMVPTLYQRAAFAGTRFIMLDATAKTRKVNMRNAKLMRPISCNVFVALLVFWVLGK